MGNEGNSCGRKRFLNKVFPDYPKCHNTLKKNMKLYGIQSPTNHHQNQRIKNRSQVWDFPGGAVVKNPPASAGDTGSSPRPGRSHLPQSD